ncbi:ABC transporter permease [Pectobacterium carotovorum subsp. carotovorum]|uniref:ABC transporter permease n=3 Tax=Pectobacterium versatile TaxID=2488639 RepID=UPI000F8C513C|nr:MULTISPECIES: ABC transporter permease [Pectobacterium]GKV82035.1 ABC transporter permease [Pectobacterium carotovorum subsp. carotovorum]MCL6373015.1 ABC transporter permease [Pectobacterium atrosepticum]RUR90019.1 MacB family efflux pump subunit [Pectobacterium versatile]GKW31806.1 ABC transporter permease [Pectobacterium carotovorum subsp. carotovorum]GKX37124.1 ABC transporter permease [Pectobacterium carotovorum subsp. carotovorum]
MSDSRSRMEDRQMRQYHYGPSLQQHLLEPLNSLILLGRRAVLALLGIAVGCGAVVALLNIGHNAETEAMGVFRGMGSDLLVATVQNRVGSHAIGSAPADLDIPVLRQALPDIQAATALIITSTEARLRGRSLSTMVVGSRAELSDVLELRLAQGRYLSDFDEQSTYIVLGANVAEQWASEGGVAALGERVQVSGYLFEIVGILQPQGRNPLVPVSVDDSILMPISGMRRVMSTPQIVSVIARNSGSDTLVQTGSQLKDYLTPLMPKLDIDVQIPQQLLEGMAQQSRMFSWLLAGLGGISLLVGGVGVMNVMVMNVSERRREIGVRMALGARPRDIAGLFLLEAVVLSACGALTGAVCGVAAAWLFVFFSDWSTFSLSVLSLPLGIGSSLVIGLFFGLNPAMTAARLEPVQALRDA